MHLDVQTIMGFQIGFELAEEDVRNEFALSFGFTVDIGIVRLVFMKYK